MNSDGADHGSGAHKCLKQNQRLSRDVWPNGSGSELRTAMVLIGVALIGCINYQGSISTKIIHIVYCIVIDA